MISNYLFGDEKHRLHSILPFTDIEYFEGTGLRQNRSQNIEDNFAGETLISIFI